MVLNNLRTCIAFILSVSLLSLATASEWGAEMKRLKRTGKGHVSHRDAPLDFRYKHLQKCSGTQACTPHHKGAVSEEFKGRSKQIGTRNMIAHEVVKKKGIQGWNYVTPPGPPTPSPPPELPDTEPLRYGARQRITAPTPLQIAEAQEARGRCKKFVVLTREASGGEHFMLTLDQHPEISALIVEPFGPGKYEVESGLRIDHHNIHHMKIDEWAEHAFTWAAAKKGFNSTWPARCAIGYKVVDYQMGGVQTGVMMAEDHTVLKIVLEQQDVSKEWSLFNQELVEHREEAHQLKKNMRESSREQKARKKEYEFERKREAYYFDKWQETVRPDRYALRKQFPGNYVPPPPPPPPPSPWASKYDEKVYNYNMHVQERVNHLEVEELKLRGLYHEPPPPPLPTPAKALPKWLRNVPDSPENKAKKRRAKGKDRRAPREPDPAVEAAWDSMRNEPHGRPVNLAKDFAHYGLGAYIEQQEIDDQAFKEMEEAAAAQADSAYSAGTATAASRPRAPSSTMSSMETLDFSHFIKPKPPSHRRLLAAPARMHDKWPGLLAPTLTPKCRVSECDLAEHLQLHRAWFKLVRDALQVKGTTYMEVLSDDMKDPCLWPKLLEHVFQWLMVNPYLLLYDCDLYPEPLCKIEAPPGKRCGMAGQIRGHDVPKWAQMWD